MSVMYSQTHFIKECTHKDMLACQTKHVKLLRESLSDRSALAHCPLPQEDA